jgi:quinoprotein glucose dehydrogenase
MRPPRLALALSLLIPAASRDLLIYPDVFRKLVRAYKLKPAGATFAVDQEFELLASDDPLFRPDGALYILDWRTDSGGAGQHWGNGKTGRIYRMTRPAESVPRSPSGIATSPPSTPGISASRRWPSSPSWT